MPSFSNAFGKSGIKMSNTFNKILAITTSYFLSTLSNREPSTALILDILFSSALSYVASTANGSISVAKTSLAPNFEEATESIPDPQPMSKTLLLSSCSC